MTSVSKDFPVTLPADYLVELEHRARRFSGAYTGTSGTLAAGIIHLLNERASMTAAFDQLETENKALREAVAARMEATPEDDPKWRGYTPMAASLAGCKPAQEAAARCFDTTADEPSPTEIADADVPSIPVDWILQGERELAGERERVDIRQTGDGLIAPQEDETPAERLLRDAIEVIRDRRPKYGGPLHHFARTVGMINAAFADVLKRPLTPADWAVVMTLDKVARHMGPSKTTDTPIDLAGYAACLAECETLP